MAICTFLVLARAHAGTPPVLSWSDDFTNEAATSLSVKNVFLAGTNRVYSWGEAVTTNGNRDVLVVAYQPDGTRLWFAFVDGGTRTDDTAMDVFPASDGGVSVFAAATTPETNMNYVVVRLSSDGEEQWRYILPGTSTPERIIQGACGGTNGWVYVCGSILQTNGVRDLWVHPTSSCLEWWRL